MYIIVNATDLLKSMQFITLTAHVHFETQYEATHDGRISERLNELQKRMEQLINEYYPHWDCEQLTDIEYNNRLHGESK